MNKLILILIFLSSLTVYTQNFDESKNLFIGDITSENVLTRIIEGYMPNNVVTVKTIGDDKYIGKSEFFKLTNTPIPDKYQQGLRTRYYIESAGKRYWNLDIGPSYWSVVNAVYDGKGVVAIRFSINSYLYYDFFKPINKSKIEGFYDNKGNIGGAERSKYNKSSGDIEMKPVFLSLVDYSPSQKDVNLKIESSKINQYIKSYVEKGIDSWQAKDEFEKTAEYLLRVTESSRRLKAIDLQKEAKIKIKSFFYDALNLKYGNFSWLDSEFTN